MLQRYDSRYVASSVDPQREVAPASPAMFMTNSGQPATIRFSAIKAVSASLTRRGESQYKLAKRPGIPQTKANQRHRGRSRILATRRPMQLTSSTPRPALTASDREPAGTFVPSGRVVLSLALIFLAGSDHGAIRAAPATLLPADHPRQPAALAAPAGFGVSNRAQSSSTTTPNPAMFVYRVPANPDIVPIIQCSWRWGSSTAREFSEDARRSASSRGNTTISPAFTYLRFLRGTAGQPLCGTRDERRARPWRLSQCSDCGSHRNRYQRDVAWPSWRAAPKPSATVGGCARGAPARPDAGPPRYCGADDEIRPLRCQCHTV
jgi:hypothetical protein